MGRRILLVEDHPGLLVTISKVLEQADYDVRCASTFADAVRTMDAAPPHLLITDLKLGGDSGLDLIARGREWYPEMAAILITAYPTPLDLEMAERYGAPYLIKPFNYEEFLALVGRIWSVAHRPRRWHRKPVENGSLSASVGGLPASVVDISHGGVRLRVKGMLPGRMSFRLALPAIDVSLPVEVKWWQAEAKSGTVSCGVAVAAVDAQTREKWQMLVDSWPLAVV